MSGTEPRTYEECLAELLDRGWDGLQCSKGECTGFIYVVVTKGGEFAKIGYSSKDPRLRMANLQTGNHLHLRLWSFFPGNRELEAHMHESCRDFSVSGEWFRFSDEVRQVVVGTILENERWWNQR